MLGENHQVNLKHTELEMPVSHRSGCIQEKVRQMCVMLSRVMQDERRNLEVINIQMEVKS